MTIPPHHFVERWFNGRCRLQVGQTVYDIVRVEIPVRLVRFTARIDGHVIAERAKFTTLLRDLDRREAANTTGSAHA